MFRAGQPAAFLAVLFFLAACAPAQPGRSESSAPAPRSSAPKRILAAIRGDPHTVYQALNPSSNIPGIDALQELAHAGLSVDDPQGTRRPQLAEAVPSLENGLWKLSLDGRMETTWRIREGVRWQDGTPFTSDDLVFTLKVSMDRELPILGDRAFEFIERVEAPDPRTLVVSWKAPYIEADTIFGISNNRAAPFAKHILESAYPADQETFISHSYWSSEWVGLGPFKIKEWFRGSHMVFEAYEGYALGRPKVDEILVKFISDPGALAANILAGAVEMPLGGRLSLEWAMNVRDQWPEGKLEVAYNNWIVIFPQFIAPNPPVVVDQRFRKALMHAVDRQEQVESLQFGLSSVAHSFLNPNQPDYRDIEARVVRYEHDPRKAAQTIEGLGYARGPDGIFRDGAGQKLAVQLRTSQGDDLQEKAMFSTADYWQRVGVEIERHLVPPQRARDREYRTTFPGFDLKRNPNDVRGLKSLHSSNTPLPENNYLASGNNARYVNPDFDTFIDRYFTTISKQERTQILGQAIYHISDRLNLMGLFYNTEPILMSNRLANIHAGAGARSSVTWNAHEWEIR